VFKYVGEIQLQVDRDEWRDTDTDERSSTFLLQLHTSSTTNHWSAWSVWSACHVADHRHPAVYATDYYQWPPADSWSTLNQSSMHATNETRNWFFLVFLTTDRPVFSLVRLRSSGGPTRNVSKSRVHEWLMRAQPHRHTAFQVTV